MSSKKVVLITEKSNYKLDVVDKDNYILTGIFAVLDKTNANNRIYTKEEYLKHLPYLQEMISRNKLVGELDHPETFDTKLKNASHIIEKIWYDENTNTIRGKIRLLDTIPNGINARKLVDAGFPLSISSRAAGTVQENKKVKLERIFTYDLVADGGFGNDAELQRVNESLDFDINDYIRYPDLPNLNSELNIIDESINIFDVSDIYNENIFKNNNNNMNDYVTIDDMVKYSDYLTSKLNDLQESINNINNKFNRTYNTSKASNDDNIIEYLNYIAENINRLEKTIDNTRDFINNELVEKLNKLGSFIDDELVNEVNRTQDFIDNELVEKLNKLGSFIDDELVNEVNRTQDFIDNELVEELNILGDYIDDELVNEVNRTQNFIDNELVEKLNKLGSFIDDKLVNEVNRTQDFIDNELVEKLNKLGNYIDDELVNENNRFNIEDGRNKYRRKSKYSEQTIKEDIYNKYNDIDKLNENIDNLINAIQKEKIDKSIINNSYIPNLLDETNKIEYMRTADTKKEKVDMAFDDNYSQKVNEGISSFDLNEKTIDEDKYIKRMPASVKKLWENASPDIKELIRKQSHFYVLNTDDQIRDFWVSRYDLLNNNYSKNQHINESVKNNINNDDVKSFDIEYKNMVDNALSGLDYLKK